LQLARPYKVDGLLEAVVERLHAVLDNRNTAAIFNAAAMAAGGGDGVRFFNPALAAEEDEQNRRKAVNGTSSSTHVDTEDEDTYDLETADAMAALKLINDDGFEEVGPVGIRSLRINTDVGGRYQQQRPETAMSAGEKSSASASATSEDETSSASADHSGPSSGAQSLGNRSGPTSESTSDVASQAGRSGKGKERVDDSRSDGRGSSRVSDFEVWKGDVSTVIGLQKRGLRGLMEGRRIREMVREGGAVPGAANVSPATGSTQNEGRVGLGIA
jgi:hypothetical protein